jgi:hypothetical protein
MKIISDTPTLYSVKEGEEIGVKIIPACTIINSRVYKDYEDISSEEILEKIKEGVVPTTSQPAIGDIIEIFEESNEELLVLPIGDGLSGTYQNAVGAKNCIEDNSDKLYHFTDLDSFIKIWLSKKLLFSDRSRMNDIAEKCDMICGSNKKSMQIYLDAVREYKQISLSKYKTSCGLEMYKSPLMWGFYGIKATGVCIEFNNDILLSRGSNMRYKDMTYYEHIPTNSKIDDFDSYDINTKDEARNIVEKNIDNIYFSKYKEWEFENELRIISKTQNYLDISGSITRIYLLIQDLI